MKQLELKIEREVKIFENMGFEFLQAWTMDSPIVPDRIKLPNDDIFDIPYIENKLSENPKDLALHRALFYYDCIRELPLNERTKYSSFIDDFDIENCIEKYKNYKHPIFS